MWNVDGNGENYLKLFRGRMVEYGWYVTIGKLGFCRCGMAQLVRLWIKKVTIGKQDCFRSGWSNVLTPVVHPHQAIILPDNTYLEPQIKEYLWTVQFFRLIPRFPCIYPKTNCNQSWWGDDEDVDNAGWPFPLWVVSLPVGVEMRSNWDNFMSLAMFTPLGFIRL